MILLKKKQSDDTYFNFDKILVSGYHLLEDKDRITQKFVNGNRKQIISEYTDVTLSIDLSTFDQETTYSYLNQLTSGEYQYYSLKDKQYKNVNFIIDNIPEITVDNAIDKNLYIGDFSVTLLKASDVNA